MLCLLGGFSSYASSTDSGSRSLRLWCHDHPVYHRFGQASSPVRINRGAVRLTGLGHRLAWSLKPGLGAPPPCTARPPTAPTSRARSPRLVLLDVVPHHRIGPRRTRALHPVFGDGSSAEPDVQLRCRTR